jgi:hypothetical protein
MFSNVALDVFIGLVFIYLLYSLLATILQEMLARWLNLRGRMLQKAIRRMLEDDNKNYKYTITNAVVEIWSSLVRFFNPDFHSNSSFTKAFFKYPTIKYLAQSSWNSKPAYISANDFSTTLIHLLLGEHYDDTMPRISLVREVLFSTLQFQPLNGQPTAIDAETLNHLQKLFLDSNNDIDRFGNLLENWFNNTMDRANGWYKSQSRFMLFFLGLFLAYKFNVDTIAIYNLLAKDKIARENMVQLAIASKPAYEELNKQLIDKPLASSAIKKADTLLNAGRDTVIITRIAVMPDSMLETARQTVMADIDKAGSIAALGWPDKDSCRICDSLKRELACNGTNDNAKARLQESIKKYNASYNCSGNPYQKKSTRWAGWLLTACAISLGATFWFDLLSKLISLRNAGNKPEDNNSTPANTTTAANTGASPIKRVG